MADSIHPPQPPSGIAYRIEGNYGRLLCLVLASAGILAWSQRFITDDAFISFRYARNLAEGHGLVFNIGERLEGYTNFLWTVLMVIPHVAGIDPVGFCHIIGTALALLTLYCTSRMALAVTASKPAALFAAALLATNPSFLAWATGGLETQLITCLLTAIVWLTLEARPVNSEPLHYIVLSLLAAVALMTRLDSAIVVGIALATITWRELSAHEGTSRRNLRLAALFVPAAIIVGAWFRWKLHYYGELLPNTFQAKVGDGGVWPQGLVYLFMFLNSYLLWPLVLLVACSAKSLIERAPSHAVPLLGMLTVHLAYVVYVGGDFMEFRLLVPVLPVFFALVLWSLCAFVSCTPIRVALLIIVVAGSLHHAIAFESKKGVASIERLVEHLHDPASDWIGVGHALNRHLWNATDIRIALTPAGAIPYYSRLPVLDMLGLTDRWVARHGMPIVSQPGHRRLAPYSYLVKQAIHLVVAHPWITLNSITDRTSYHVGDLKNFSYLADTAPLSIPPHARLVEIPLDSDRALVALYLTKHPAVDVLINTGRWRAYPLRAQ